MFKPKSNLQRHALAICVCVACFLGCHSNRCSTPNLGCDPNDLLPSACATTYLTEPDDPCIEDCGPIDTSISPLSVGDYASIVYQDLTLDQCIGHALQNSKVFRDLGGTIITTPQIIDGIYDPSIVTTDPRFSEEAALSAFDANFSTAAFFQNNDQASNLTFQGNNGIFRQDFHDYRTSIQKLAATGTLFTLSNLTNYDNSNQTGQTLPHSWQTIFQGEFRHPLLQGSGVTFNRIAGPSVQPGVYGGVLIARTNTEISLSQFREGVRDLVSEVENAYWDLYFAYRNLEATIEGRDKAYEILVQTTEGKSREGSQAQAQAKEQYLRFERDVLDAMEGRPTLGTRNNNGMSGGVFLSNGGVRVAERRLRLICGLPINAIELLRTSDEPAATGVQFDWDQSVTEAFNGRQELVQQRWLIKQRELQLLASKNFLKPRFDLIGQYRFRGTGRSLTGGSNSFQDDLNNGTQISSAFGDLTSGDFQEWQVGAEFSMPIGFRAAHLGVRNAELALSRERAILQEQKREVIFGLSNAFGELRRTFATLKAAEEQYVAAREFQYVMKLEVERGRDRDIELEAQRRAVDAEIAFRQAQIEYMLALKNIHFEKGTYLEFCNVQLSESQSNPSAQIDASERASRRGMRMSYVSDSPIIAQPKSATSFLGSPVEIMTESNELVVPTDEYNELIIDESLIPSPHAPTPELNAPDEDPAQSSDDVNLLVPRDETTQQKNQPGQLKRNPLLPQPPLPFSDLPKQQALNTSNQPSNTPTGDHIKANSVPSSFDTTRSKNRVLPIGNSSRRRPGEESRKVNYIEFDKNDADTTHRLPTPADKSTRRLR